MPKRLIKPFQDFFRHESSSGIILIFFAIFAIYLANTANYSEEYEHFIHYKITLGYGDFSLSYSLLHWVNDGLMAIFFFLVGMEIKRELVIGELNSVNKAALPIGAAIGGMLVPALIYVFFNFGTTNISGWGIPMATDIAFALAALSVLGSKKAPEGLAIFLTALAIVDDLGAILVIALFYTETISFMALLAAALILTVLILANKFKINLISVYMIFGILLWFAVLKSGVHATVAGVLLGMVIPVKSEDGSSDKTMLFRLEHALQPWVAFVILPFFAFTNAGVSLDMGRLGELLISPVSVGIIGGLFIGKQLGIFGATYLMVKLNIAALPHKINMRQLYGVSILGGIGFTMSIFIATLAFQDSSVLATAKISIILASTLSAAVGFALLSIKSEEKTEIKIQEGH